MASVIREPCDEGLVLTAKESGSCPPQHGPWILAATILASSMVFIDGTVVNVALPALQQDLSATAIGVQWVVESYSLFLAALLLAGGALGDRFGRKRLFLIGVGVFALASAWCGLAPDIAQLIIARGLQGIGGALLVPGSLAIISASFPPERRGRAIGTWSGFSAITTAVGPVLGGWLIENVSWRAVFFLNLPLAAAVVLLALKFVAESRDRNAQGGIDWLGAGLATAGLGGVCFGLIESSRIGFRAPIVLFTLIGGLLALLAFVLVENRVSAPMLPLRLFRSREFAAANLLTLLLYFALSGVLFFLTLNLIQVQNFSATAAGAALLPFILIMFTLSRWSGGLLDRYGPKLPLTVGPIIAATGCGLLAMPGTSASYWTGFLPGVAVLGLGMAISVAPLTTTVMSSVDEEQAGTASGVNNAVSRTAGLLAIAVLGVVMLQVFADRLAEGLSQSGVPVTVQESLLRESIRLAGMEAPTDLAASQREAVRETIKASFVTGFRTVAIACAVLSFVGALISWVLMSNSVKRADGSN